MACRKLRIFITVGSCSDRGAKASFGGPHRCCSECCGSVDGTRQRGTSEGDEVMRPLRDH